MRMKKRLEAIVPITDLQTRSKELVEQVHRTGEPVVITQRGRPAAMLVSYELYEGHLATRDEISFPDWQERLRAGELDIERGDLVPHEEVVRRSASKRRPRKKR